MLRVFIVLFIFIGIELFGLVDFYTDRSIFGINTFDFFIFLTNCIFFVMFFSLNSFKYLILSKPLKYIFYLYVFVILVFISMPIRGDINLIDVTKVGRDFLILPIAFIITYDVLKNKAGKFYHRLIILIGLFTSLQIILNAFNPDLVGSIFEYTRAREGFKYGDLQRNNFLSKSMLFPHLCSLLIFWRIINKPFKISTLILFVILFLGASLQGFRSYFIVLCLIHIIQLIYFYNHNRVLKIAFIAFLGFPIVGLVDATALNNQISNKFITVLFDVEKDEGSSLKGRWDRDNLVIIPRFLQKPLFGWGFIHYSSPWGQELGLESNEESKGKADGLYTIDSGWLTMLMYFGIVGLIIYLFIMTKYLFFIFKNNLITSELGFAVIGFPFILFFPLITHGGFYSDFGLLPMSFVFGSLAYFPIKYGKNENYYE